MKKILFTLLLILSFVFVKAQMPQAPIIFNNIDQMINMRTSYTVAKVNDALRGGVFNKVPKGSLTPDDGIIFQSIDPNYVWIRDISQSIGNNIQWYGAVPGTDVTSIIRSMGGRLNNVYIPPGKWYVDTVSFRIDGMKIFGNPSGGSVIKMVASSAINGNAAFRIKGKNITVRDLEFDGQNIANRTMVRVDSSGVGANVYVTGRNLKIGLGTGTVSVLQILADSVHFGIYAKNLNNVGATNGATPRVVEINNNAFYGDYIIADSCHTIARVQVPKGAHGHINKVIANNCFDNGVYLASGRLDIDYVDYEGNEEAVVAEDSLTVSSIRTHKRYTRALSIQNTNFVNVGEILIDNSVPVASDSSVWDTTGGSGSVVGLRRSNVASGYVNIGSIRGINITRYDGPSSLIDLSKGTVDEFHLNNMDVNYIFQKYTIDNISGLLPFDSITGSITIGSIRVHIIDKLDSITSSASTFRMTLPKAFTKPSYIGSVLVDIVKSDGVTKSPASFIISNMFQPNLKFGTGFNFVRGADSNFYAREFNYDTLCLADRNTIDVPLDSSVKGYFRYGEKFVIRNQSGAIREQSILQSGYGYPSNTAIFDNGLGKRTRRVTSSGNITTSDEVVLVQNGVTVTLPAISTVLYRKVNGSTGYSKPIVIKNIGTSNATIAGNGLNITNGIITASSITLLPYESVTLSLSYDGGSWINTTASTQRLFLSNGTNASTGTATLSSGTVTVSNTSVTANSIIIPFYVGTITNSGSLSISSKTANVGFTILSSNASDANTVNYLIIN